MKKNPRSYINEILLYSGQYALFYVVMNFSKEGFFNYFTNYSHVILLAALIFQTIILANYGEDIKVRLLGSLICPTIYTLSEFHEFRSYIINISHLFFWVFSIFSAVLNALNIKSKKRSYKYILEFSIVFINIVIFIFIYFYFDLIIENQSDAIINPAVSIFNFNKSFIKFIRDKAHIYIISGGVLLGISIGLGRIYILNLKDKLNELFGKYIDQDLRDIIIENNGFIENKENIAVLFSDIRDFTSISENSSSSEIVKMLNLYFSKWNSVVKKHKGYINKFIGDAVLVIFENASTESASTKAVKAALELYSELENIKKELKLHKLPEIKNIGIGISYGEVILGNIGSDERKDFTVIGDTVNIAARLESQTKLSSSKIIITKSVYNEVNEEYKKLFHSLGDFKLKGKEETIHSFGIK